MANVDSVFSEKHDQSDSPEDNNNELLAFIAANKDLVGEEDAQLDNTTIPISIGEDDPEPDTGIALADTLDEADKPSLQAFVKTLPSTGNAKRRRASGANQPQVSTYSETGPSSAKAHDTPVADIAQTVDELPHAEASQPQVTKVDFDSFEAQAVPLQFDNPPSAAQTKSFEAETDSLEDFLATHEIETEPPQPPTEDAKTDSHLLQDLLEDELEADPEAQTTPLQFDSDSLREILATDASETELAKPSTEDSEIDSQLLKDLLSGDETDSDSLDESSEEDEASDWQAPLPTLTDRKPAAQTASAGSIMGRLRQSEPPDFSSQGSSADTLSYDEFLASVGHTLPTKVERDAMRDGVQRGVIRRFIFGSIQNKIIVPFFILTLLVAAGGTFLITRLAAGNVQDRLTNQLIETSRSASDSIVISEQSHIDILRLVAFTIGVPEAMRDNDGAHLTEALLALAANQDAPLLLGLDVNGNVIAGVQMQDNGFLTGILGGQNLSDLPMVASVLAEEVDDFGDKYAGIIEHNEQSFLLSTAPIKDVSGELVGAIAVGSPINQLLLQTKANVLADMTFYQAGGTALETTHVLAPRSSIQSLDISSELYDEALIRSTDSTSLAETTINRREFQTAYIPLKIRRDTLGVLGVAHPTTIISTLIRTNRNGLAAIFSLVATLTIAAGYAVARSLSNPIRKLALAAEAVSKGDLNQQSGVRTPDEIGVLGVTFDSMTRDLNAQNNALQTAYGEQQKEAAFLSAILTSTADGIVVLLPDGSITHMNRSAKDIISANPEVWHEEFSKLITLIRSKEVARRQIEISNQWTEALAAPVLTSARDEVGTVVTLRDITDQVLGERMRTGFIMQMSHELYTPLTAIKGYADLAKAVIEDKNPQATKFLEMSTENAEVLNKMIGQMLDVAQITRGGLEISLRPTDINQVLRAALTDYEEIIDSKNFNLNLELGVLKTYSGDDIRLEWAFDHLLSNAFAYTLPDGSVTIRTSMKDGSCIITIEDTGIGIGPRDLPRIFDQFYRGYPVAPDGTVIDVRGAGLGLFIVERVVKGHSGEITVTSEHGKGTKVTVKLPYTPPSGPGF